MVNQVHLAGYVPTDPRYWDNQDRINKLSFRLGVLTGNGSQKVFITVVAWADLADKFKSLAKGDEVLVTGKLTSRKAMLDSGEAEVYEINAETIDRCTLELVARRSVRAPV